MIMNLLTGIIVVAGGFLLIGLTVIVFAAHTFAERFLLSFASSAKTHYIEQALRTLVGTALIAHSPAMWQAHLFEVIGWAIVISSLALILVPWQWHHRLGERVLPMVVRHMRLYASGSFVFGALLLHGVFAPFLTVESHP